MTQVSETLNPRIIEPLRSRYLSRPENQQIDFNFTTPHLSIEGLVLVAQCVIGDDSEICRQTLDLSHCWLPATAFTPHPTPLLVNQYVLQSTFFALDRIAQTRVASFNTPANLIGDFRHLLYIVEWGFLNGIPTLDAFTRADVTRFESELKEGGIITAMRYSSRIENAVNRYSENSSALKKLITYRGNRPSLTVANLAAVIGAPQLGSRLIPNSIYRRLGEILSTRGCNVHDEFFEKGENRDGKLTVSGISGLLSTWNLFCEMPPGYDGFSFTPFPNVGKTAKDIGKPNRQTCNLGVEEVTDILSKAHLWLQNAPIPLCRLLRQVKDIILNVNKTSVKSSAERHRDILKQFRELLEISPDVDTLEQLLGIKISRKCYQSGRTKDEALPLADCITVLASSCFVVIAIYNARRKTEIAHPIIGLRRQDIGLSDEATGIHTVDFHINKKKFSGRVGFIVNRSTGQAINTMIKLKDVFDSDTASLFSIPNLLYSESTGRLMESEFSFTRKIPGATGKLFLELALGCDTKAVVNAHAFRRFHAVLFHYQYSNARLSALTQQLGHVSADETMTYITDNRARELHECIVKRIRRTDAGARDEADAVKALKAEIEKECRIVGQEKMASDIVDVLLGNQYIGGNFPQYVIRAHRFFSRKVEFSELEIKEQGVLIADLMVKHGRYPKPTRHSNCVSGNNNEARRKHNEGACMPERCLGKKGCMNSCVFDVQLEVMKADLNKLDDIISGENSFDALPIQVLQAEQKHVNITRIIELQERNMRRVAKYAEGLQS